MEGGGGGGGGGKWVGVGVRWGGLGWGGVGVDAHVAACTPFSPLSGHPAPTIHPPAQPPSPPTPTPPHPTTHTRPPARLRPASQEQPGCTLGRQVFDEVWRHSVLLLQRGFQTGSILTVDPQEVSVLGKPWTRRCV